MTKPCDVTLTCRRSLDEAQQQDNLLATVFGEEILFPVMTKRIKRCFLRI